MYSCRFDTPLGQMIAAAENQKLVGVWFMGQKHFPEHCEHWVESAEEPVFKALKNWMEAYFNGENPICTIPLEPKGTDFQKKVWKHLLDIPYGTTSTYGDISKKVAIEMGKPTMSAQAVGGAIGKNPISIIIPCHRVIGTSKALTGYAGGLDKKEALLRLEA